MYQTSTKPTEILKEDIKKLKFNEEDVLTSKEDIAKRKNDLDKASALGAHSKSNIKIYFVDENGTGYKVIATVWATTEKNVSLKKEIMIPIKSIYEVGFF
ncbi:MAG: hypothetical protein CMP63_01645 [Flavobacteriales bacterium]|nr:hypothetical protein [Flavobacteriales bacterium]|tara:strand:+ start:2902 stop:3201 length:300 start_codon:yes stop_codon:yes gene_type:complete